MLPAAEKVREITGVDPRALPDDVLRSSRPLVLKGLVADWPMVLVPLDATHPTAVGDAWLDRLAAHDSEAARFAAKILDFYVAAYTPTLKRRGAVIHDALAAMLAVDPGVGEYVERPVRVELRGELTRGTTVWDARSLPAEDDRRPVKVAVGCDAAVFHERLLASILSL